MCHHKFLPVRHPVETSDHKVSTFYFSTCSKNRTFLESLESQDSKSYMFLGSSYQSKELWQFEGKRADPFWPCTTECTPSISWQPLDRLQEKNYVIYWHGGDPIYKVSSKSRKEGYYQWSTCSRMPQIFTKGYTDIHQRLHRYSPEAK